MIVVFSLWNCNAKNKECNTTDNLYYTWFYKLKVIPCGYMGYDRHCKQEMGKEDHLKAEQSVWYILIPGWAITVHTTWI